MKYIAEKMIKNSRHINYYNSLNTDIQKEIIDRINTLILEEKQYCDNRNYSHLCNIFAAISIYEVLQSHGKTKQEAFDIVSEEMYKFIQTSKRRFQKLSRYKLFWPVMKKIIPIGFKYGSGTGWRYTWHFDDEDKNQFRFETNECIYQKIFKKRSIEELGPMFCKCDIINYGELNNIDFIRTKTLCYKDDMCDFKFVKHLNNNFIRSDSK